MKKFLITIILFLGVLTVSGQKKSRADRFFEKGDFLNAALSYEEILNEEGYSKPVLLKISESYYNTFQFKSAYRYLKILTGGKFYAKDKSYGNKFNFMMYQVLSALGDYDKAVTFLKLFNENKGNSSFDSGDAIRTIETFKLKEDNYTIKEGSFNSTASEFGAVKIDSLIYFTTDQYPNGVTDKQYKWTHRPFLDIRKIAVDVNNQPLGKSEEIEGKINGKLHEGNFCFTQDQTTLYLSRSNYDKGKKKFDSLNENAIQLYKATKIDGKWTVPEKLSFNNVAYSIEHPALNSDGTKLYFSSNMPGGYGDFDIYYMTIDNAGIYGDPVNMGSVINTEHREQFPFVSKDDHLFFASNGHLGLGMLDLFVSEFSDSGYKQPVNLGAPINSRYDDFSINYYNETDGFFASNRKKGGDDIYEFSQIGEIFIREYVTHFEVRDFNTEKYVANAEVNLKNSEQSLLYSNRFDSIASFSLTTLPGNFELTASAVGYETRSKPIKILEKEDQTIILYLEKSKTTDSLSTSSDKEKPLVVDGATFQPNSPSITAKQLKAQLLADSEGPPVIEKNGKLFFELPPIYFDYDKWNIRADSKKVLDEFALKLDKYKTVYIKISAHTDSRGTANYNQVLSEKRAESTRNYLALIGYVNARRMQFQGFGESQPLINCEEKICSEEEHQTNRRSEFEIIKF
ncbi:OmpA family protein [Aquimarina sp. W85]|uniref:OmpA family protein n=1 Tax=Aquimarina rhodophyticola TaxID=3342246 RepID=UPI003670EBB7